MDAHSGFSLSEALVVLALLALVAAIALPNLSETRRKLDLERLARQVAADALRARMEALTSCRNVGLVFSEIEGRPYYVMVADGNGNGVSRRDFLRNVDKALGPRVWLEFLSAGTRLGVPREWQVPDPSGDGTLGEQGLRAGSTAIISFSRFGHATPSSVYFNDGRARVVAVRVHGGLGRIRTLLWQRGWVQWQEVRL
jgi:prepilin-type N-terminal cleavage/methylation domain-containing protein